MANIKSNKKRALTNEAKRQRNVACRSMLKTAAKKLLASFQDNNFDVSRALLQDAESKIARARSKGVLKDNTAARKISALAKAVARAYKQTAVAA